MPSADEGADFFVSYTQADARWALWIAIALKKDGYTTLVQALDIRPGMDFVHEMQQATIRCRRTIAVLSPDYFQSGFGEAEWRAAFVADPTGDRGLLIPVRVRPCDPPGLLASRVYIDLVGLDEDAAAERLRQGLNRKAVRLVSAPFPGAAPPGTAPQAPDRARLPDLWEHGLVAGARAAVELGRSGRIDVDLLAERGALTTHELAMTRWLLARRPSETGPPLLALIRAAPYSGPAWASARWAGHAPTPVHHDLAAEPLAGFIHRSYDPERDRAAMVGLGSCGASEFSADVVRCALAEPPKLASRAAESLLLMLLATQANDLPRTGSTIVDGLDELYAADDQSLQPTRTLIQAMPAAHALLLASRWLSAPDVRRSLAADAVGFAQARRALPLLVEQAHRQPERASGLLRAVGLIGGAEAVELLVARIDLPTLAAPAREALCLCLADAPGVDVEALTDRLLRAGVRNRWAVLFSIGTTGLTRFLPDLVDGLTSAHPEERGMAALALAEFERSSHLPAIRAVFHEATVPDEILVSGVAVLRLCGDIGVVPRLEAAAVETGPIAPAIHQHLLKILADHGGAPGRDLAAALRWVQSGAVPSEAGPGL